MRGNRRRKEEIDRQNQAHEAQHYRAGYCPDKPHNLFFISPDTIKDDEVILRGRTFHHLKHVLRRSSGDSIFLTDGRGARYTAEIVRSSTSVIHAKITHKVKTERMNQIDIELAFVPLKGQRNDFIIEKGTELGITTFRPFISRFSVIPFLSAKKLNRFKNIALSAMLQSQQYFMPDIISTRNVRDLTKTFRQFDLVVVADRGGAQAVPIDAKTILLIVGPEGGFDQDEIAHMKNGGATVLSLGLHRLRSETAALYGITKILTTYHWKEHE
jgi:16S rRNA (uracil1498-N3)-methyltransferase